MGMGGLGVYADFRGGVATRVALPFAAAANFSCSSF